MTDPSALRDTLITSADAIADKLDAMDRKLDLILAGMTADAAADRHAMNGTRPAPKPSKPLRNGHGGHQ